MGGDVCFDSPSPQQEFHSIGATLKNAPEMSIAWHQSISNDSCSEITVPNLFPVEHRRIPAEWKMGKLEVSTDEFCCEKCCEISDEKFGTLSRSICCGRRKRKIHREFHGISTRNSTGRGMKALHHSTSAKSPQ